MKLIICMLLALAGSAEAQSYTFTTLYSFTGSPDGQAPMGGLILDASGNLYGTTQNGGTGVGCAANFGVTCGTIFKLAPDGTETVLYSFAGGSDGSLPQSVLVRDAKGNLYGTTFTGGTGVCYQSPGAYGCGTVFRLDPAGQETILHSFSLTTSDGALPYAGLRRDKQGNLYGTTTYGGISTDPVGTCNAYGGCGTVFKIDPAGNETVLYSFPAFYGDAGGPYSRLIGDGNGNLYGTGGGGKRGKGTVFKLNITTGTETILFNFCGGNVSIYKCPYGKYPMGGVARDAKGNLYGTTSQGGIGNWGVVYKISPTGKETLLHRFGSQAGDGECYCSDLLLDAAGNLYGVNEGTVFKITPTGTETILYNLYQASFPQPSLVMDSQGSLYGVTTEGGDLSCNPPYGCGTVFKLSPQ